MPLIKTLNILLSMRNNTQRIYERLSRGEFLSVDSSDTSIRHLYDDIEDHAALFCQLVILHPDECRMTGKYATYQDIEYPIIYAK